MQISFEAVPAIFRVLAVFVLILIVIKRKWTLGNAFLLGTVCLGLIFFMSPFEILYSMVSVLKDVKSVSLAVVVTLILVLSSSLEKSNQMTRLLEKFRTLINRPQIGLLVFPALIGLLPMPGGAIFSAPIVKKLGEEHDFSNASLSYINYWFRHIWEYWWPLYPGILLTTTLAGIDLWHIVSCSLPITVVVVIFGFWPLRGFISYDKQNQFPVRPNLVGFVKEILPIAFVIIFGLSVGQLFSNITFLDELMISKESGLIIALTISIIWIWRQNSIPIKTCFEIMKQPELLKMVYLIVAILTFKAIIEDSRAIGLISEEMLRWNIPLLPIIMILPFLVGIVSGITIAFVGTTFPILVNLIISTNKVDLMLPFMVLGMVCGFIGVLISPLHLCLLLSNEYFKTTLVPVYNLMKVPIVSLFLITLGYFFVLSHLAA